MRKKTEAKKIACGTMTEMSRVLTSKKETARQLAYCLCYVMRQISQKFKAQSEVILCISTLHEVLPYLKVYT